MPKLNGPRAPEYGAETCRAALTRRYKRLAERGRRLTRRGEFRGALEAFTAARDVAHEMRDATRADGAELNRAMALIQMGEARRGEEGLREILLRTNDRRLCFRAAYNLAASLRKQGRYERAMSYALRAADQSRALRAPELKAGVHNLMGNILLNQSYLDEALVEYEKALALRRSQKGDNRYSMAILEENIGYCLLLQGRLVEGTARIERALELATAVEDRRCRAECLQDLCYGNLLLGQFEKAASHGALALAEAERGDYRDIEENCHYLLGELGTRTGDSQLRDQHFERLQELHPELPFLKDFLCSVDVTSIITLKR